MVLIMAALLSMVVTLLAAPAAAAADCRTSCGLNDFSYPFGIGPGCSLQGFNLTCDAKKRLLLGSPNVTVDYTILASGSVSALAVYVAQTVQMGSGAGTFSTLWEGPGTPFAISGAANMSLFVLGCGVTATLLDRGGTGAVVGNCSVVCAGDEVMRRLPDGLCVGLGCCPIDLSVHLRAFTLNISRAGDGVSRDKLSFLVAGRDKYTFRTSDLEHDIDVDMVPPARLDWAIPDQPDCRRAMDDRVTYACVSNQSECRNSPIGGYTCHCSRGFSGNPYVVDGCTPDQVYGSSQPKENCPTMCGNVSVPFPFGTELGCFARINLYLTCNPGSSPAILQMTEHLVVTDISINEGVLRIQKLSDPGDFLGDRSTTLYSFSEESGMLKWAVDNSTCKEAMLNKNEYRCVSARSDCVDVTDDKTSNHVGYRCKCSSGFQGNPYLQDGCTGKFLIYVYLMIRKKYTLFPFSW
ncbi:hypothetical protein ACQ4PT_005320 [Festuca glaucescens]